MCLSSCVPELIPAHGMDRTVVDQTVFPATGRSLTLPRTGRRRDSDGEEVGVDVFSVHSVAQVLGSSNAESRALQKQNGSRNTESLDYTDGKRPPDGVSRTCGELPAANPQRDLSCWSEVALHVPPPRPALPRCPGGYHLSLLCAQESTRCYAGIISA